MNRKNSMMRQAFFLFFISIGFFINCGDNAANIKVAVLTPPGKEFVKSDISSLMASGDHRGVFFRVYQLKDCPASNVDYVSDTPVFIYPQGNQGLNPGKAEFKLKSGVLDQKKLYAIEMLALDNDNVRTHSGRSDCYVYLNIPNLNDINICFRVEGDSDDCTGYQPANLSNCNEPVDDRGFDCNPNG